MNEWSIEFERQTLAVPFIARIFFTLSLSLVCRTRQIIEHEHPFVIGTIRSVHYNIAMLKCPALQAKQRTLTSDFVVAANLFRSRDSNNLFSVAQPSPG